MNHRTIHLAGPLAALYLLIDEQVTRVSWAGLNVIRDDLIKPAHQTYGSYVEATFVHVMSRPAGGEVRGYAIIDGVAHLRLPARPYHWPEVDAAVGEALGIGLYGAGGYADQVDPEEVEADGREAEAERMHGDHQTALESVYGPNE